MQKNQFTRRFATGQTDRKGRKWPMVLAFLLLILGACSSDGDTDAGAEPDTEADVEAEDDSEDEDSTDVEESDDEAEEATTDEAVELTFLTFETPALGVEFWDASIGAALDSVEGVEIERLITPDADRTGYAKQLQSSGQFPDLLSSIDAKEFTDAGLLEPFDQDWLNENFIIPDASTIDGETYIPPTNAQILPLVYYNKTIFEENDIALPTTWDEFLTTVGELKAAGVVPIEMAGLEAWSASMPIVALASADVLGQDADWVSKRYAGDVAFGDEAFVAAMQKHRDLIELGAYSDNALSTDFPTANANFLAGDSGMYIMGSWFTGTGYMALDIAETFGAFPLPTDDGSLVVPFNVGGTTSVSAASDHVDKALEFAKAWSVAPASMAILVQEDGAIPLMKGVSVSDFDVTVSSLYNEIFDLALDEDNTKVSAFGWVGNEDSLAPGIADLFYVLAQSLFENDDIESQLIQLDTDWDAAVG